jgi:hypothetical protein
MLDEIDRRPWPLWSAVWTGSACGSSRRTHHRVDRVRSGSSPSLCSPDRDLEERSAGHNDLQRRGRLFRLCCWRLGGGSHGRAASRGAGDAPRSSRLALDDSDVLGSGGARCRHHLWRLVRRSPGRADVGGAGARGGRRHRSRGAQHRVSDRRFPSYGSRGCRNRRVDGLGGTHEPDLLPSPDRRNRRTATSRGLRRDSWRSYCSGCWVFRSV